MRGTNIWAGKTRAPESSFCSCLSTQARSLLVLWCPLLGLRMIGILAAVCLMVYEKNECVFNACEIDLLVNCPIHFFSEGHFLYPQLSIQVCLCPPAHRWETPEISSANQSHTFIWNLNAVLATPMAKP